VRRRRVDRAAVLADDLPEGAQLAGAHEALGLDVVRLPVDAVADHQPAPGAPAGVDHLPALGRRHGHRLLAEHVLAGLRRPHGVLGVQRDRQDHVHRVDRGVVAEAVEVVVRVDAALGEAVRGRDGARLVGVPLTTAASRTCSVRAMRGRIWPRA
jgi:hypothetical protein